MCAVFLRRPSSSVRNRRPHWVHGGPRFSYRSAIICARDWLQPSELAAAKWGATGAFAGSEACPVTGVVEAEEGGGTPAPAPAGVMSPVCLNMASRAEGLEASEEADAEEAGVGATGGGGGCTAGICGAGDRKAAMAAAEVVAVEGAKPPPTGVAGLGIPAERRVARAPCPRRASRVKPEPPPLCDAPGPTPAVTDGGRAMATGGTGTGCRGTATGGVGVDVVYAVWGIRGGGGAARMFTASSATLSLTSIN